jgi:ABC-type uncharacterized transport system permease subunit
MSKKYKDYSIVQKVLFYLFHTLVQPKTKYNYLISGIVVVLFGLGGIFVSIYNGSESVESNSLINQTIGSKEFWFLCFIIITVNISAGFYFNIRKKK